MRINFLDEKFYDLILISSDKVSYFRLKKTKFSFSIIKAEAISGNLLEQGVLRFENLEKSLGLLISKHKLKELGIVLNLPNILFQRISLPRSGRPKEVISNYLRTSFPLPIEKYTFFYREDKYKLSPLISNFNIFFIEKTVIDNLLSIIEKYGLIPLFITTSLEIVYQYIINRSVVSFDEEYLVFFIDEKILISFILKNLRIEKVIIEGIDSSTTDFNLLLVRLYNFLKTNLNPEAKVIFLTEKKEKISEISHQQMFFDVHPTEVLIEGGYLIFNKVFSDQDFIDFLPLKSYSAYFFNRLPSITIFLSVYVALLMLIFSGFYFALDFKIKNEINKLNNQKITIPKTTNKEQIENFISLKQKLNSNILESFDKIKNVLTLTNLEAIEYSINKPASFTLRVSQKDLEKIKADLNQIFPEAKLIQEEKISDNEVKLVYSF